MNWGNILSEKYFNLVENEPLLTEQISFKETFAKGEYILQAGDNNDKFYFIEEGSARGFYTDDWGEDHTLFLPEKGFFFAAPECTLQNEKTTKYTFIAESNIVLRVFHFKSLEHLARSNPYVFDFYTTTLKNVVMAFIFRLESFVEESPEERYLSANKTRPSLQRLFLKKHMASFLGISANSLSRIQKRLLERD